MKQKTPIIRLANGKGERGAVYDIAANGCCHLSLAKSGPMFFTSVESALEWAAVCNYSRDVASAPRRFVPSPFLTTIHVRKGVVISARHYDCRGNCQYERLPHGTYQTIGTCHLDLHKSPSNRGLILFNLETREKFYAVI